VNSYANNPRTQFIYKAFNNNSSYDFAQETRGYDLGGSIAWVNPNYAVRFGTFAMPTVAGGPDLAYNLNNIHSEQLEVELHAQLPKADKPPFIVRLLGYRNVADMGNYSDALAAEAPEMAPDTTIVTRATTRIAALPP
jgi:hypothetical protein